MSDVDDQDPMSSENGDNEKENSDKATVKKLRERLLELRKQRRKIEKELEDTMAEFDLPLEDPQGDAEKAMEEAEDKRRFYERMGVKVRMCPTKGGKLFYMSFLNWSNGKIVQTLNLNGTIDKKHVVIVEHEVQKQVCETLDKEKLPMKMSSIDGKLMLRSIHKSIFAYFERHNQFVETEEKNEMIQCSWTVNCREIQIKVPIKKGKKNLDVMLVLKYDEQSVWPHNVDAVFLKGDESMLKDLQPRLNVFLTEYLNDALELLLGLKDEEDSTTS